MVGNVLQAIAAQERVTFGAGENARSVRACVLNGDHARHRISGTREVSGWWLPDKFEVRGLGAHRIVVQVEYQREVLLRAERDVPFQQFVRQLLAVPKSKPRYTVALVDDDGRIVHTQPYSRMQPRIVAVRVEPVGVEEVRLPLSEVLRACLQAAQFIGDVCRDDEGARLRLARHHERDAVIVPRRRRTWSVVELREVLRMKDDFPHGEYQREVARRYGITERNARRVIGMARSKFSKKSSRKRGSK